jgi:ABC-type branched-subunit amino acid transport system ATPase component
MNSTETSVPAARAHSCPLLAVDQVSVRFGGLTALDAVSVEVPPGNVVGLIGPNGAGKSTLFNVISGMTRPQSGAVALEGRNLYALSVQQRSRLGLSRTFQHPEVFGEMTVRENVCLAHRMSHSPKRIWSDFWGVPGFRRPDPKEQDQVEEVIESIGIEAIADRRAKALPLGFARLLEVARAIVTDPKLILLDEPSSGLDTQETDRLVEILLGVVRSRGVSLLLVEHDIPMVLRMSNRIYVLEQGRCIAEGTPEAIRNDPSVEAAYFGRREDLPQ